MLSYGLKFLVLAVSTLGVVRPQNENEIQTEACFSHGQCPSSKFCAWSSCIDANGIGSSCGICKDCLSCLCDTDSIDSACPRNRCPAQPSEGVRYFQGVFLGNSPIDNSNYTCARRLIMSGATVYFLQIPVHEGHPASQEILNISRNSTVCPSIAFSGIIVDTDAIGDDGSVGLRVADGVHLLKLPTDLIFLSPSAAFFAVSAPSSPALLSLPLTTVHLDEQATRL